MKEKTMTLEELKHRLDDVFSSIRSIDGEDFYGVKILKEQQ